MLVDELFEVATPEMTLENLLVTMDWAYDMDLNEEDRFSRGHNQLKKIKAIAQELAKKDFESVNALWEEYCPWASQQSLKHFLT